MADPKGTLTSDVRQINHILFVLEVDWVADAAGEVNDLVIPHRVEGKIVCVDTKPGTVAPDNLYDPVLWNAIGEDVMNGALADRSSTLAQRAWPKDNVPATVPASVHECLELDVVNNSVKNATGKLKIYFDRRT